MFCVLDADPDLAAANCSWDPAHEDPDTTEQVPEEAEVPETVENPERSGSFLVSTLIHILPWITLFCLSQYSDFPPPLEMFSKVEQTPSLSVEESSDPHHEYRNLGLTSEVVGVNGGRSVTDAKKPVVTSFSFFLQRAPDSGTLSTSSIT